MTKTKINFDEKSEHCKKMLEAMFFSKESVLEFEERFKGKLSTRQIINNEDLIIKLLNYYKSRKVLEICGKGVFNNKAVMLRALQLEIARLNELSSKLRSDRAIVLCALKKNALDLKYASRKLRSDRYVVLKAFFLNKKSFVYASEKMKNDKSIALKLLEFDVKKYFCSDSLMFLNNDTVFSCLGKKVLQDKEVAMAAVKVNGLYLKGLPEKFKKDEDVVCAAIESKAVSIEFAHSELFSNKKVMLQLVNHCSDWLSRCSEELRDDKELVLSAVSSCGDNFAFASWRLRADYEIILAAYKSSVYALNYAKESVLEEVKEYLKRNGGSVVDALNYLKEKEFSEKECLLLDDLVGKKECLGEVIKKTSL